MTLIQKAVEFDKLAAAFKKKWVNHDELAMRGGWWAQAKYDGIFGMAVIRRDREDCAMLTRTGESISASCEHILDALHDLRVGEDFHMLGEIWAEGTPFPAISGRARQQRTTALELDFVAFDMLPPGLVTDVPYAARFARLVSTLATCPLAGPIKIAETRANLGCDTPTAWAERLKAQGGYDGVILRDPRSAYTIGLVKQGEIVKVKPVFNRDLRVVGWDAQPGVKTGRLVVTLQVEYRGVVSSVGSGVPHDIDPDVAESMLGTIVEIEAMGLTPDGKLREPRFIRRREDKEHPDE